MCHRVREPMSGNGTFQPLSGTIKADERLLPIPEATPGLYARFRARSRWAYVPYCHRRDRMRARPRSLRDGRERRRQGKTMRVPDATGRALRPIMLKGINVKRSRLMTDGNRAYRRIKDYMPYGVIDHEIEYLRGDIHTQNVVRYWSNLKRGVYGVFHHVSEEAP